MWPRALTLAIAAAAIGCVLGTEIRICPKSGKFAQTACSDGQPCPSGTQCDQIGDEMYCCEADKVDASSMLKTHVENTDKPKKEWERSTKIRSHSSDSASERSHHSSTDTEITDTRRVKEAPQQTPNPGSPNTMSIGKSDMCENKDPEYCRRATKRHCEHKDYRLLSHKLCPSVCNPDCINGSPVNNGNDPNQQPGGMDNNQQPNNNGGGNPMPPPEQQQQPQPPPPPPMQPQPPTPPSWPPNVPQPPAEGMPNMPPPAPKAPGAKDNGEAHSRLQ